MAKSLNRIWKNGMWRTRCSVPFCGRTMKSLGKHDEFLCGKHFRLADERLIKRFRMVRRVAKRRRIEHTLRVRRIIFKIWVPIKRQAIERGAGL